MSSTSENTGPLALIVADAEVGYNVCDRRDGLPIAWRYHLSDSAAIAALLNASYPAGSVAPARDTLIHEVACSRIVGELV
jgi:hypothetical protein